MPLPQAALGAAENVLVKAEGNTMRITVTWVLHDDDTSVVTVPSNDATFETGSVESPPVYTTSTFVISTSKYGGSVDTADEQARFLTEEMQLKGVEYQYQLIIGDTAISRGGLIEKISLQKSGSTPVTWKATLQFIVGDVVTISN
tara:strand:- start:4472 stop:4906 length:435 start_codon:yes stop_codon:yes gene_type:complete